MLDQNMIRWINASVNKYFKSKSSSIKMYIEGEKIDLQKDEEWAEVRITGPRYKELSKDSFHYEVDVNILISVKSNMENIYRPHQVSGIFASAMDGVIPINKLGDTVVDDSVLIGCLELRDDVPRSIDVVPWGVLDATTNVFQIGIDGFFKMEV